MNKQISLSVLNDELLQVRTKKKEFLEKIERIIPFDEWIGIIEPYYYKGERGNKPYDLELMLRIYLLRSFGYEVMNEVTDSRAFSDLCGVDSPIRYLTEILSEDSEIYLQKTEYRKSCFIR